MDTAVNETNALFGIYLLLPYFSLTVFLISYSLMYFIGKLTKINPPNAFLPSFGFALPFSTIVGFLGFFLSIILHFQSPIVFWTLLLISPVLGIHLSRYVFPFIKKQ